MGTDYSLTHRAMILLASSDIRDSALASARATPSKRDRQKLQPNARVPLLVSGLLERLVHDCDAQFESMFPLSLTGAARQLATAYATPPRNTLTGSVGLSASITSN